MTATPFLLLASALFCVGVYGLLSRRDAIGLFLSLELMANGGIVALVTMAWVRGAVGGQVFALFAIGLTVVEVAAGLALLLLLYRQRQDTSLEAISELRS